MATAGQGLQQKRQVIGLEGGEAAPGAGMLECLGASGTE